MGEVNRKTRPARSATWHRHALLLVTVLASCSGRSPLRTAHDGAAAGGTETGGILGLSGGNTGSGAADASSSSGTGGATGGATSTAGAVQDGGASVGAVDASRDGWCDETPLWDAIAEGEDTGLGSCLPFVPDYHPPGCGWVMPAGYVVFDGDGRVVDNTKLSGAGKQTWLDGLSTMRWPCLAGQTVQYMCVLESDEC